MEIYPKQRSRWQRLYAQASTLLHSASEECLNLSGPAREAINEARDALERADYAVNQQPTAQARAQPPAKKS